MTVTYSNGAIAVAEANFNALYGYDVRGEVFGSAGMVTAGGPQATSATSYTAAGIGADTVRLNVDLFHDAYTAELAHFVDAVKARRDGVPGPATPGPGGDRRPQCPGGGAGCPALSRNRASGRCCLRRRTPRRRARAPPGGGQA